MGSSCWPSAVGARLFALLNNPWSGPSTEKYSKFSLFLYSKTLLLLLVNVLTRSCHRSTGRPHRVTKAKCLDIQVNARTRRGRFGHFVLCFGSCEPVKVIKPQRSTRFLLRGIYGSAVWRSFQGNHKDPHKHVIWTTWLDQQKVSLISQLVLHGKPFQHTLLTTNLYLFYAIVLISDLLGLLSNPIPFNWLLIRYYYLFQ